MGDTSSQDDESSGRRVSSRLAAKQTSKSSNDNAPVSRIPRPSTSSRQSSQTGSRSSSVSDVFESQKLIDTEEDKNDHVEGTLRRSTRASSVAKSVGTRTPTRGSSVLSDISVEGSVKKRGRPPKTPNSASRTLCVLAEEEEPKNEKVKVEPASGSARSRRAKSETTTTPKDSPARSRRVVTGVKKLEFPVDSDDDMPPVEKSESTTSTLSMGTRSATRNLRKVSNENTLQIVEEESLIKKKNSPRTSVKKSPQMSEVIELSSDDEKEVLKTNISQVFSADDEEKQMEASKKIIGFKDGFSPKITDMAEVFLDSDDEIPLEQTAVVEIVSTNMPVADIVTDVTPARALDSMKPNNPYELATPALRRNVAMAENLGYLLDTPGGKKNGGQDPSDEVKNDATQQADVKAMYVFSSESEDNGTITDNEDAELCVAPTPSPGKKTTDEKEDVSEVRVGEPPLAEVMNAESSVDRVVNTPTTSTTQEAKRGSICIVQYEFSAESEDNGIITDKEDAEQCVAPTPSPIRKTTDEKEVVSEGRVCEPALAEVMNAESSVNRVENEETPTIQEQQPVIDAASEEVSIESTMATKSPAKNVEASVVIPDKVVEAVFADAKSSEKDVETPVVDTMNAETSVVNAEVDTVNAETPVVNTEADTVNAETTVVNIEADTVNPETPVLHTEADTMDAKSCTIDMECAVVTTETTSENGLVAEMDPVSDDVTAVSSMSRSGTTEQQSVVFQDQDNTVDSSGADVVVGEAAKKESDGTIILADIVSGSGDGLLEATKELDVNESCLIASEFSSTPAKDVVVEKDFVVSSENRKTDETECNPDTAMERSEIKTAVEEDGGGKDNEVGEDVAEMSITSSEDSLVSESCDQNAKKKKNEKKKKSTKQTDDNENSMDKAEEIIETPEVETTAETPIKDVAVIFSAPTESPVIDENSCELSAKKKKNKKRKKNEMIEENECNLDTVMETAETATAAEVECEDVTDISSTPKENPAVDANSCEQSAKKKKNKKRKKKEMIEENECNLDTVMETAAEVECEDVTDISSTPTENPAVDENSCEQSAKKKKNKKRKKKEMIEENVDMTDETVETHKEPKEKKRKANGFELPDGCEEDIACDDASEEVTKAVTAKSVDEGVDGQQVAKKKKKKNKNKKAQNKDIEDANVEFSMQKEAAQEKGGDKVLKKSKKKSKKVVTHKKRMVVDKAEPSSMEVWPKVDSFREFFDNPGKLSKVFEKALEDSYAASFEIKRRTDDLPSQFISNDDETIWQMINHKNKQLTKTYHRLKNALTEDIVLEGTSDFGSSEDEGEENLSDEMMSEDFEDGEDEEETDLFNLKDEDLADLERQLDDARSDDDISQKPKKKFRKTIVDDKFFSVGEMEAFCDEQEKNTNAESFLDTVDDSWGGPTDYKYNDYFGIPSDSEEPTEKRKRKRTIDDAKDSGQSKKRVRFVDDVEPEMDEQLEEDYEDGEAPNAVDEEERVFFGQTEDDSTEKKTKHKISIKKLKDTIKKLEEENLQPRSWELAGEVAAHDREENTMLETHVQFDHGAKRAPEITESFTEKLEAIIKQRIKDKTWDDPIRKEKVEERVESYRNRAIEDVENVKKGLAEVYEKDYLKAQGEKEQQKENVEEHKELQDRINKLFNIIDALTNFDYTPPQVRDDVRIVSNMPALRVEEVGMTASTDEQLLAPEEIKKREKGAMKSTEEREKGDKLRERRKKKIKQRAMVELMGEERALSGQLAAKKLKKKKKSAKGMEEQTEKLKSSEFFGKLQETVTNENREKTTKKKKKKILSEKVTTGGAKFKA